MAQLWTLASTEDSFDEEGELTLGKTQKDSPCDSYAFLLAMEDATGHAALVGRLQWIIVMRFDKARISHYHSHYTRRQYYQP